jgi:hypothetical protein
MGPEAKLWKTLKPLLEREGCMVTRIENRHGGGLPDVCVSSPVGIFMIELKISQKISVGLSDMQIAYNTLLTHKHGLSFILAEAPCRPNPLQFANPFLQIANLQSPEDQGPSTEDRGRVGSGTKDQGPGASGRGRGSRVGSGRGQSGLGPRASVGSGRDRYYLWHGRDAVDVGRSGLRAEALASGSSLSDLVQVMLAVCRVHHEELLGKGPGR